jgi:hypothetical protein
LEQFYSFQEKNIAYREREMKLAANGTIGAAGVEKKEVQ